MIIYMIIHLLIFQINVIRAKNKQIFIVGSSRIGTTMMSRILSNHHKVFHFMLHFLYKDTKKRLLSRDEQVSLFAKFVSKRRYF